jgi:hypothetical protein
MSQFRILANGVAAMKRVMRTALIWVVGVAYVI